jgi:hypothetical protein
VETQDNGLPIVPVLRSPVRIVVMWGSGARPQSRELSSLEALHLWRASNRGVAIQSLRYRALDASGQHGLATYCGVVVCDDGWFVSMIIERDPLPIKTLLNVLYERELHLERGKVKAEGQKPRVALAA